MAQRWAASRISMNEDQDRLPATSRAATVAQNLLRVLEHHTGRRGLAYAAAPAPLSGGYWAEIYAFRLQGAPPELSGELVLRLMPDEDRALREAAIQGGLAAAGFPTPHVHLSGDRDGGLGRPFFVMDRAPGGSLAHGLKGRQKLVAVRSMPGLLAEAMVRLHRMDVSVVIEALERAGWSADSLSVEALLAECACDTRQLQLQQFRRVLDWLRQHELQPKAPVLCHGDMHGFNLVVGEGAVSAVLDWSNARIADPRYDVAYTAQLLALFPVRTPAIVRPITRLIGRRAARQFLHAYGERVGEDVFPPPWFEALHSFRLLLRLAKSRLGIAPAVGRYHPWELAAPGSAVALGRITGIMIQVPLGRDDRRES